MLILLVDVFIFCDCNFPYNKFVRKYISNQITLYGCAVFTRKHISFHFEPSS